MKEDRQAPRRAPTGRIAAVHAQIALVALLVVGQLWMLTSAWNELELGHLEAVVTLTLASGVFFFISLVALLAYRE